jgi:glycosyltransferase involved in cell wall biosynthesis
MYNPRRGWLGRIYKLFYQFCLDSKAISCFICHSSTERENYLKEFGQERRNSIVFLKLGGGKPFNTAGDHGPETGRYFFSGGSSNRDYRTLVESFYGLEERLVIACYPSDVKGLRIPPNVEIRHNVYGENFTHLMERSYAVIIPLLKTEVSSGQLVLLDAMRLGKPIAVTKGGCTRDYLPADTGIIIEPYCVEGIRTAVQHLVRDPEHARRLGQKAKEYYERDHTVMRYAQRLAAVFCNGT